MGWDGGSFLQSGGPLPAARRAPGSALCWLHSAGRALFTYPLDKMCTRGGRVKPVGEILRFVGHQSFAEVHDAHRVRGYAVIGKHEFSDPEIAAADYSPDCKALLVRLDEPALLNVAPAADPLARLRIIEHGILAIDFVLAVEIVPVGSIPMALQRRPHGLIVHLNLPRPVGARGNYFPARFFSMLSQIFAATSAPLRRWIARLPVGALTLIS